jgi:hypothetical protein
MQIACPIGLHADRYFAYIHGMRIPIPARVAIIALVTAGNCGCANTTSLLTTGGLVTSQSAANDPQSSRLHQVAATSARAKRCGFNFDPARLKASYLDYELRQGATTEQVSSIAQRYDTTLMTKLKEVEAKPTYCSDRVTALIKVALERHVAGDFTPTTGQLPTPAAVSPVAEEPWDTKEIWVNKWGRQP